MTEKKEPLILNSPQHEQAAKARKVIVPKPKQQNDITVIPSIENLMNDALSIIGAELIQYRSKVKRGVTLDLKEARAVQGYLDTMVKLSKEAREAARAQDLSELSDEELLQLATQLAKGAPVAKADKADKADKAAEEGSDG